MKRIEIIKEIELVREEYYKLYRETGSFYYLAYAKSLDREIEMVPAD
jgi:hypothetical protein